jgi:hypothetical protein
MLRRSMIIGALALALCAALASSTAPAAATSSTFNATGVYCVASTGTPFTKGLIHFTETGTGLAGTYGHGGTITGALTGTNAKATWNDQRGDGWMTLAFTPHGRDFTGTWGLKGKPSSGDFSATRIDKSTTNAAACD